MLENPYNPFHPIVDPIMFYGREDAIAFLQLHLSGRVTKRALLILGASGIGKSSLLTQVPLVVDERYPSVNIDLGAIELNSPVALVATIVDKTRAMMNAIQASTYRLPPFPDPTDPNVDLLKWLADDYLDVVLAAIRRQRHLVLMFDNLHLLFAAINAGQFPADFMAYLQSLLDRYEQLDILATLDITHEEEALQTPPFDDTNQHFRLTMLPFPIAEKLLTEPVTGHYRFSPDALERALNLAGGHPFQLHSLGRLIYRRWEESRHINLIDAELVESVYPAALEMAGETVEPLTSKLRQNEQIVLMAILGLAKEGEHHLHAKRIEEWLQNTKFSLNALQVGAALRGLEYWTLLQSDTEGRYYFPSTIQADWLARQIELDQEKEKQASKQPISLVGLFVTIGMLLLVGAGIWLSGVFDGDEQDTSSPSNPHQATVTLVVPSLTPPPPTRTPFLFGG